MSTKTADIAEVETDVKISPPKRYKVVLLNDNKTTFDFVVMVLVQIFDKSIDEAARLTNEVDKKGSAVAGIYVYSVAELKQMYVHKLATDYKFPFKCIIEEE